MASEAISEHLISEKFPGGACPQTPPNLVCLYKLDVHVTPPSENPGLWACLMLIAGIIVNLNSTAIHVGVVQELNNCQLAVSFSMVW